MSPTPEEIFFTYKSHEEAITMVMQETKCSRAIAEQILEQYRREHPDQVKKMTPQ